MKAKKKKNLLDVGNVRRVASFLALERDRERVVDFCVSSFGCSSDSADALIKAARQELALAADVDFRVELGKRREQLEDLRERARRADDLRVELATIQELNKLANLYQSERVELPDDPGAALARQHLEALGVAPNNLPLEELARLVANYVANLPEYGEQKELRKSKRTR